MLFFVSVFAAGLAVSAWIEGRDRSVARAVGAMVRRSRPRTDLQIERRRWSV